MGLMPEEENAYRKLLLAARRMRGQTGSNLRKLQEEYLQALDGAVEAYEKSHEAGVVFDVETIRRAISHFQVGRN